MSWRDLLAGAHRKPSQRASEKTPAAHGPVFPPKPSDAFPHAADHHRAALAAAVDLPNDTLADDALIAAIGAEIEARRRATATLEGPPAPRASNLRVRSEGLPDWWHGAGNLLLCGSGVGEIRLGLALISGKIENQIVVIGEAVEMPTLSFSGGGGLVVLGDNVRVSLTGFTVCPNCTILIGENSTIGTFGFGDARNGGVVIVGDGNVWGGGASFMTDDAHAIRDVETNRRLNVFGGRIVIDRHVWLGDGTRMMGDCFIGQDSVIERDAFVKNRRFGPHSQAGGRPAKLVRTGVSWSESEEED